VTRIGVVSDTHLPRFGRRLPAALLEGLAVARVSRILHAGDHTDGFVVDELSAIAPVEAVAGNNDPPELVERFGTQRIVDVDGVRIGLTHGHAGSGNTSADRARSLFVADDVAVVVFGHSHQPLWRPAANGLPALLNPGSPTDRRREPAFSYALLEIDDGRLGATIERFADRRAAS
jgi:putative phosphoesterase